MTAPVADRGSSPSHRRRRWLAAAIVPALLIVVLLALVSVQAGAPGALKESGPAPLPPRSAPTNLVLGVATSPLARNWWQEWQRDDLVTVNRFEHAVGAHTQIVMWYADWQHNARPQLAQLRSVAARGSIPEITWEPWDASAGLYRPQPNYRLRNIIEGKFDPYIRGWAQTLAAWGGPVLLRFAQEMDGNWYPWDEHANGNRAGEFVRAWRHVRDIFTRAGATNVKWVWSPAFAISTQQFPGAEYVDMLGLTCLNSGATPQGGSWRSFAAICERPIRQLHALAPAVPIQLSEVGTSSAGGSRTAWIAGMFEFLRSHPEIHSLVWFNVGNAPDWVLESSDAAKRQFALGLRQQESEAWGMTQTGGGRAAQVSVWTVRSGEAVSAAPSRSPRLSG